MFLRRKLTEMEIVVIGVTEKHESTDNVDDG